MLIRIFFLICCSCLLGRSQEWIDYDGKMIEAGKIIIKFNDSFAPQLGVEMPLSISDITEFDNVKNKENFKNLIPLFKHYDTFTSLHYTHQLHQYYTLVLIDHNETFSQTVSELLSLDIIEHVEFSGIASALLVPNDELYPNQWDHDNWGQAIQFGTGDLIGTPDCDVDTGEDDDGYRAWDITTGSSDIVISIVDTGVDLDHPDLIGKFTEGYDFFNDDDNADGDDYALGGHGTAVAGIAAANSNNEIGIAGICWDCKIMPVKVLDQNGYGNWEDIANGIVWSSDNGAHIINLSLGGGQSQDYLEDAVNYSVANGTVTIAAAGNINVEMDFYPASYDNCIAVGALSPCCERKSGVNSCDEEYGWGSTYGDQIDFMAPGVRIFTTRLDNPDDTHDSEYYTDFNGTSSACPHAAGIAGLVLSQTPNLSPEMVRSILQMSADDLLDDGYDIETGFGRLNAYNALMGFASGDLNSDDEVNVSDILLLLDIILFGGYSSEGDMNLDGFNNINDIIILINLALNQ